MEDLELKLDQLKQSNPIKDVAISMGLHVPGGSGTVAIRCFNTAAHPNGDIHPSCVLQPDTNSFECKSCGIKGDALKLIELVKGVDFKTAVLTLDPNFYPEKKNERPTDIDKDEYWNSRGISEETKVQFKLTIRDDGLYIPLPNGSIKRRNFKPYFKNNEWVFQKFIFFESKGKCLFYAGDKSEVIFITEGELDAIKGHQETGFTFVSDTTGATSFEKLYLNDPYIKEAKKIYIIPDNDKPGLAGALKTAQILGLDRCYQITLPEGKDITEYFVKFKHTGDDFKALISSAVSMQSLHTQQVAEYEANALNFGSLTEEEILKQRDKTEVLHFGIQKMDEGDYKIDLTPGFIVIAAPQGIGKSWMMLHLARVFFLNHSKKSVIITLEMPKEALKERALQSFNHLTQEQYENGADLSEGIALLRESKLVIQEFGIEDANKITVEELEKIVDVYYSQGYRVFQFDHLHQISGMSDGKREKEVSDKWAMAIKAITAKYKDIWFIAYAQATKEASRTVVTKEGIRYGVRFVDVCDMFFSLNKPALFTKGKNLAKVNLEEEFNTTDSRLVFIYLGKARYSSLGTHGWNVTHSKTGNFIQPGDLYDDVQPESSICYTRVKPKTFAPLPDFTKPKAVENMTLEEVQDIFSVPGSLSQERRAA